MLATDRAVLASFGLAGLLWLHAWPRPPAAAEPCAAPVERSAREGHSREVACDGSGPPLRGPARLLFGQKLDLASADARALDTLPGIGPARAEAILTERARRPFAQLEDLVRVRGIGPHSVARLREWVEVRPLAAEAGSR